MPHQQGNRQPALFSYNCKTNARALAGCKVGSGVKLGNGIEVVVGDRVKVDVGVRGSVKVDVGVTVKEGAKLGVRFTTGVLGVRVGVEEIPHPVITDRPTNTIILLI